MRHHSPARRFFAFGLIAMFAGFMFFAVEPAYAITIVPPCARASSLQTPGLDCVIQTFTNVARLILGITGSMALLMFVYGGFMLLTSGGVEARVTTGKTIIKNAVIGIVLILTAFYIIDYAVRNLQGTRPETPGTACYSGRGVYVSIGANTVECRYLCTKVEGYYCRGAGPATGDESCTTDYVCSGSNQTCCTGGSAPATTATNSGG